MRCLSSQMRDARSQICKIGVGMRTLLDLVTTCRCCVQCRALFFVRVSNAQVCSKAGSGRVCCMSAKVPSPDWCAAAPIDSQRQSRRQCGKKKSACGTSSHIRPKSRAMRRAPSLQMPALSASQQTVAIESARWQEGLAPVRPAAVVVEAACRSSA